MNTISQDLGDVVARLQREEATVAAARNALNEKTARAQAAFHQTEQQLGLCIRGLTSGPRELEAEEALLAELEERRAIVLEKQTSLEKELADAPDPLTIADGRERDREHDRQWNLHRALERLHEGTLIVAPGVVAERLSDLDARIAELQRQIADARARLDAHVRQAEALLGETVTAAS